MSIESINLNFTIDAHEERDVMVAGVSNALVQTCMPSEVLKKGDRIIMKLKGILVDILYEYAMNPLKYEKYIVLSLLLVITKVPYGMSIASLLWYKPFKDDLMGIVSCI